MDYSKVKYVKATCDIECFGGKGKIFKGSILHFEHVDGSFGMAGNKEQLVKIGPKWTPCNKDGSLL